MKLLENPGKKLKSVVQVVFILGLVVIILVAILCIVAVSQVYYYRSNGLAIFIIIAAAAVLFLALWVQALFISAYADISDQLKRQTEILEKIESKGQPLS